MGNKIKEILEGWGNIVLRSEHVEEIAKIKDNPGLFLVKTFEDIDVYEVIADPLEPKVE